MDRSYRVMEKRSKKKVERTREGPRKRKRQKKDETIYLCQLEKRAREMGGSDSC